MASAVLREFRGEGGGPIGCWHDFTVPGRSLFHGVVILRIRLSHHPIMQSELPERMLDKTAAKKL